MSKRKDKNKRLVPCPICGKNKVLPSEYMCEDCYRWIRFG